MKISYTTLTSKRKAIIVGAAGGIAFFIYYALGQRPPNYITPLNPVGMILFFPAIGAMGAFAAGEWKKASRAARYGACAGATTGAMASLTLIILHNYVKYIHGSAIDFSALLHDLPYYVLAGLMLTAMIAAVTLAMGAAGAFVFSCMAQFVDTTVHFSRYRR
ncbi:MAG TPA: hypothetical protein VGJ92_05615 [Methanocella sp.]|jgi:hypothetical protein